MFVRKAGFTFGVDAPCSANHWIKFPEHLADRFRDAVQGTCEVHAPGAKAPLKGDKKPGSEKDIKAQEVPESTCDEKAKRVSPDYR